MCGIVGYVGKAPAAPILLEGLSQLEYRGYDSAGIAVVSSSRAQSFKVTGRVADLRASLPKRLTGSCGIGHTRWATHGAVTTENAHPHSCAQQRFFVVHNGIIDNAAALRSRLENDGVTFTSETDTEVIAHLVATASGDLRARVMTTVAQLSGTYALGVVDSENPGTIVAARLGSPLLLGIGNQELFLASDAAALVRHTSSVVHLDDGEFAELTATSFSTFTADQEDTGKQPTAIGVTAEDVSQGEHKHFMMKEILEQPEAARRVVQGRLDARFGTARLDGLQLSPRDLRSFNRVKFLGCGSSYYVGELAASMMETIARLPASAEPASEFRYRNPVIEHDTLYVAMSQSGETADTAFAVNEVARKGGHIVGLVNVVGSTIARACTGGVYLHAGAEIAVASTKSLTNMSIAAAMLAVHLGRIRDLSHADGARLVRALERLPEALQTVLDQSDVLADHARVLTEAQSVFFIGRTSMFPVAREGAQKLKEISYLHAEAYPASELKHGPLALIDETMPSVVMIPNDDLADRNVAAARQIEARHGRTLLVTHEDVVTSEAQGARIVVPQLEPELDPIVMTIPLQLLAYFTAEHLGRDIDKPRNLAKSVTVE